jgi:hypothetical protein
VYGSGDPLALTADDGDNFMYKFEDATNRQKDPEWDAPLSTAGVCSPLAAPAFENGAFALGEGERLISPPMVADGVVAWSVYKATADACVSGESYLYAMDFETCVDAFDDGGPPPTESSPAPPEPREVGKGIATAPVLHRASGTVVAGTSASIQPRQMFRRVAARARSAAQAGVRALYWRPLLDLP